MFPPAQSVVISNGSSTTRAGFSNQDLPDIVMPSVYQNPYVFDDEICAENGDIYTIYKDGLPYNWDALEQQWSHIFNRLGVEAQDSPLVTTHKLAYSPQHKAKHMELVFEKLQVPVWQSHSEPLCHAFGLGKANALVIDMGASHVGIFPVLEGLVAASQLYRYAGDFSDHLISQHFGLPSNSSYDVWNNSRTVCRELKHVMTVPPYASDAKRYKIGNTVYNITKEDSYRLLEPLFTPGIVPEITDATALNKTIISALKKINNATNEAYSVLLSNLIITGGNSLTPGLEQRVISDMTRDVPQYQVMNTSYSTVEEKLNSVWSGAGILSGLDNGEGWIGKQDYEEMGADYLAEKW